MSSLKVIPIFYKDIYKLVIDKCKFEGQQVGRWWSEKSQAPARLRDTQGCGCDCVLRVWVFSGLIWDNKASTSLQSVLW